MRRTASLLLTLLAVSCSERGSRADRRGAPPPPAEFLVATEDSTFWVTAGATGVRVRGAPLVLANSDGRWYELFLADDDRSFASALFVGEMLYRRDLTTGDSAIVFADTVVPRLARAYGRAHPADRPLDPDEEGDVDPPTQATSELEILGVHGPFVSYQLHFDVALDGADPWHATRRGVLDLRSGRPAAVRDVASDSAAARVIRDARAALARVVDSVRRRADRRPLGDGESGAAAWILAQHLDERSFGVTDVDGKLEVEFAIPERSASDVTDGFVLDAIDLGAPRWWTPIRSRFPRNSAEGDRWSRDSSAAYAIVASYDARAEHARLSLEDARRGKWTIADVAAPVRAVYYLDRPAADSATRRALTRAFDEASLYDESTRTVRFDRPRRAAPARPRFTSMHRRGSTAVHRTLTIAHPT